MPQNDHHPRHSHRPRLLKLGHPSNISRALPIHPNHQARLGANRPHLPDYPFPLAHAHPASPPLHHIPRRPSQSGSTRTLLHHAHTHPTTSLRLNGSRGSPMSCTRCNQHHSHRRRFPIALGAAGPFRLRIRLRLLLALRPRIRSRLPGLASRTESPPSPDHACARAPRLAAGGATGGLRWWGLDVRMSAPTEEAGAAGR